MSLDIVHALRGFRRRSCGDIVRHFTGGGGTISHGLGDKNSKIYRERNPLRGRNPPLVDDIPADGGDDIRSCGADWGARSERSEDFVAAYAAISFAVLPGEVSFPMDWETKIQRFTGNEIRFADEIHRRWTISPPLAGTISSLRSD